MYSFEAQEPVRRAVARIAREELDQALEWLGGEDRALDRRVHEPRKHIKRLRGLLALTQGAIHEPLRRELLQLWRSAARALAELRSEGALLESLSVLQNEVGSALPESEWARVREALQSTLGRGVAEPAQVLRFSWQQMEIARSRVGELTTSVEGWAAFDFGFRETYKSARHALEGAVAHRSAEAFHAFRTPTKRHMYQIQLLEPYWPGPLRARRHELSELGERLGDHHDLCLLREWLMTHGVPRSSAKDLFMSVDRHVNQLEKRSIELGRRCFAETPRAITKRFRAYVEG